MRQLKIVMGIAASLLIVAVWLGAQDKPAEPGKPIYCVTQAEGKCSELARTQMMLAYTRALLASQNATAAQTAFQTAVSEFNQAQKEAARAEGRADTTTYQIDIAGNTIKLLLPAPPAEPPARQPAPAPVAPIPTKK